MSPKQDARKIARELNLDWRTVCDAFDHLLEQERERLLAEDVVRMAAWSFATSGRAGYAPFWTFGFAARWGKKFEEGDHTNVPKYDQIHQVVSSQFPQWDYDGAEADLIDFLMTKRQPMPSRRELWSQAIALAQAVAPDLHDNCDFPFGAESDDTF